MASTLGVANPLTYRGYVYDTESGLYYLQSRYYNANVGRFINADTLVSTGQGLLGNNMFAYCLNSPISLIDESGTRAYFAMHSLNEGGADDIIYVEPEEVEDELEPYSTVNNGTIKIYIVPSGSGRSLADEIGSSGQAFVVEDLREAPQNANMRIYYSYLVDDPNLQREILNVLIDYNIANPSNQVWSREVEEMLYEWDYHNWLAKAGFNIERTGHVDLDMKDKNKSVFQKGLEFIFG